MGEYDSALVEVNKSIRINNKDLNLYLLRGTLNMELKNFDDAALDFDKVISDSKNLNKLNEVKSNGYQRILDLNLSTTNALNRLINKINL